MHNQKGISKAIVIIIIAVVLLVGGFLAYKYSSSVKEKTYTPVQKYDFSKLDKDGLLHKLFPFLTFNNGIANLPGNAPYENLKLYLKNSNEDYFINNQEKNLLLVAKLDGVAHAGGLYHSYLGLFDGDGKLLTSASTFGGSNYFDTGRGENGLYNDKAQFGGDQGEFSFYDCNGVKYILFVAHFCPNGSCCNGQASLYNVSNGQFKEVQKIDQGSLAANVSPLSLITPVANADGGSYFSYKLIPFFDKITVKKVPNISRNGANACPETDYKVLNWNKDSCRFE